MQQTAITFFKISTPEYDITVHFTYSIGDDDANISFEVISSDLRQATFETLELHCVLPEYLSANWEVNIMKVPAFIAWFFEVSSLGFVDKYLDTIARLKWN